MKSLKTNILLYTIRNLVVILFPLIIQPYVVRKLGVEQIGICEFSKSIVSYFIMLAGLGVANYLIREGSKLKQHSVELEELMNEVYSINALSTCMAYLGLLTLTLLNNNIRQYASLIAIYSLQIFFTTIGKEYILIIYEDFFYITIRAIIVQAITLAMIFLFIKSPEDVELFALFSLISSCGALFTNVFYTRKHIRIHLCKPSKSWLKHFKPIITLFAMTATLTVYTSSDITLLGILVGDHSVGIYSVATKIYALVKGLIASVLVVFVPRISGLIGQKNNCEIEILSDKVYSLLLSITIPASAMVIIESKDIVTTVASLDFIDSGLSLSILGIALTIAVCAYFWEQCILIPYGQEKNVLIITIISAIINIVLNIVFIPVWNEKAAALSTLIAELISFFLSRHFGKKYIKKINVVAIFVKSLLGCIPGILLIYMIQIHFQINYVIRLIATGVIFSLIYVLCELILGNEIIRNNLIDLFTKIKIFRE